MGGLFQGLGKLLDAGANYLQHQQFIERLRGMQLEDAKTQLASHVRGMPDAGFNGLKLALTVFAKGSQDPTTKKLLNGLLESLDAARAGRATPAPDQGATAEPSAAVSPARSFEDDLTMVAGWYELNEDARITALSGHLVELTPDGYRAFRAHVARMVDNVGSEIRAHEANEDNAWGGCVEDRMSYMMARIKTGQRDPAFLERLRELQRYGAFYQWVGEACGLVWEERERRLQAKQASATPAPAAAAPVAEPAPPSAVSASAGDNPLLGPQVVTTLRAMLQEGLANGTIRPERRASHERLLDKIEGLLGPLNDPARSVDEKSKHMDRFRVLLAEFQQAFDVDVAACELSGDPAADERALCEALDGAWYGRQRTTAASSLHETFAFLDRTTRDHPRRRMLEATGLLDEQHVDDGIGFAGSVKQILREQGLGDLLPIYPAWAGRYPDEATPVVFHVMAFSEPWSNDVRDAARGYEYRRGDEADEGRIVQAIWDEIGGAHVVLIDLTGLNLNVMIELGMAHALGRTALTVRHSGLREPLPRNIEKLRVLDYDGPAGLSRLLEKRLPAKNAQTSA